MFMNSTHKRRLLIFGILGVLFAVGGGCLAYLATATPGTRAVESGADGPSGIGETGGLAESPRTGSSSGGGGNDTDTDTAPPKPGRSIGVTGVDLNGGDNGTCMSVINNQARVPLRVASVRLVAGNGVVLDASGCPGDLTRCTGARLGGGDTCYVGVRLTRNGNHIPLTLRVTVNATCTGTELRPCEQVAGRSPSPANPIEISWSRDLQRAVHVSGGTDGEDSPPDDEQEKPDPQEPPDVEETPEPLPSVEAS